ncbi:MAG: reverse transcriptase-like protein [Halobacteriales archaeon]
MPTVDRDPAMVRRRLEAADAAIEPGNTEYERWRAELGEAVAIGYDEVVVVQGRRPGDILRVLEDHGGRAHVYFDGASRGNPGPAAIAWVVVTDGGIVEEGGERAGELTNNEAEYAALERALRVALELGFDAVDVRGDSELVVRQVTGRYDVSAPHLKERRVAVRELLDRFEEWTIEAIPRSVNARADRLANEALDER